MGNSYMLQNTLKRRRVCKESGNTLGSQEVVCVWACTLVVFLKGVCLTCSQGPPAVDISYLPGNLFQSFTIFTNAKLFLIFTTNSFFAVIKTTTLCPVHSGWAEQRNPFLFAAALYNPVRLLLVCFHVVS